MKYTTTINNLNPYFVTGFCDAEACFSISKNPLQKLGWGVKLVFSIHLHSKDVEILYAIQRFFCVGNVTIHGDSAMYQVVKLNDILHIIKHFDTFSLKTQKHADFLLFKEAYSIVRNKEHLKATGLEKIVNIRASLNKGLPERLKIAFPNYTPVDRPLVPKYAISSNNLNGNNWIAGFVTGEGCFFIKISKSKTHKLGSSVALNFKVVQNVRDSYLLKSFIQVFGCGSFVEKSGVGIYSVSNLSHIIDIIIPFFDKYPILGAKAKDLEDFKKTSVLIKSKLHLTKNGLDKIILIKSGMNFKR